MRSLNLVATLAITLFALGCGSTGETPTPPDGVTPPDQTPMCQSGEKLDIGAKRCVPIDQQFHDCRDADKQCQNGLVCTSVGNDVFACEMEQIMPDPTMCDPHQGLLAMYNCPTRSPTENEMTHLQATTEGCQGSTGTGWTGLIKTNVGENDYPVNGTWFIPNADGFEYRTQAQGAKFDGVCMKQN